MLAQIQDNTYKAYVALQSYVTSPSNIPIPGIIHTDRSKLTREQMAARIREQNTDPRLDINRVSAHKEQKPPVMLQKPTKTANGFEKFDYELPLLPEKQPAGQMKRAIKCPDWNRWSVREYLDRRSRLTTDSKAPIKFEFISKRQPDEVCSVFVPEFVVCRYPSCYLDFLWDEGRSVLDYHDYEALPDSFSKSEIAQFCGYHDICPTPEKTPEAINRQIENSLSVVKDYRIFLSRSQLDNYLQWRKDQGKTDELEYILVSEKTNASATDGNLNTTTAGNLNTTTAGNLSTTTAGNLNTTTDVNTNAANAADQPTGAFFNALIAGVVVSGLSMFAAGVVYSRNTNKDHDQIESASTVTSEEMAAENDTEDVPAQEESPESNSGDESSSTIISISTSISISSSDQQNSEEDSSIIV